MLLRPSVFDSTPVNTQCVQVDCVYYRCHSAHCRSFFIIISFLDYRRHSLLRPSQIVNISSVAQFIISFSKPLFSHVIYLTARSNAAAVGRQIGVPEQEVLSSLASPKLN
jgi:hypothetical protein